MLTYSIILVTNTPVFNLAVLKSPNKWKKRNAWTDIFVKTREKKSTCNIFQNTYKKNKKIIKNKNIYMVDRFSKRIFNSESDIDSISLIKTFTNIPKK